MSAPVPNPVWKVTLFVRMDIEDHNASFIDRQDILLNREKIVSR